MRFILLAMIVLVSCSAHAATQIDPTFQINWGAGTIEADVTISPTATLSVGILQALTELRSALAAQQMLATGELYIGPAAPGGGEIWLTTSSYGPFRSDTDADNVSLRLNYIGYQAGTSRYRDLTIHDGKGGVLMFFDGSAAAAGINGATNLGTGLNIWGPAGWSSGTKRLLTIRHPDSVGAGGSPGSLLLMNALQGGGALVTVGDGTSSVIIFSTTPTLVKSGVNKGYALFINPPTASYYGSRQATEEVYILRGDVGSDVKRFWVRESAYDGGVACSQGGEIGLQWDGTATLHLEGRSDLYAAQIEMEDSVSDARWKIALGDSSSGRDEAGDLVFGYVGGATNTSELEINAIMESTGAFGVGLRDAAYTIDSARSVAGLTAYVVKSRRAYKEEFRELTEQDETDAVGRLLVPGLQEAYKLKAQGRGARPAQNREETEEEYTARLAAWELYYNHPDFTRERVGFIADDVKTPEKYKAYNLDGEEDGIDTGAVQQDLVTAVRVLLRENAELKAEIAAIKAHIGM